jgi:hypothetical protein
VTLAAGVNYIGPAQGRSAARPSQFSTPFDITGHGCGGVVRQV